MTVLEEISKATRKNWEKLKANSDKKLTKRANKRLSLKKIIPVEYFLNKNNISFVEKFIKEIENKYKIEDIIYSTGINLLLKAGIFDKKHVQEVLSDYKNFKSIDNILKTKFPDDEFDILGIIYQSLLFEGEKNIKGSYYTPVSVCKNMTKNLKEGKFLDPSVGSGAYFLASNIKNPNNLYGIDNDPLAVFISKINLLIKYKNFEFKPNIILGDFLSKNKFDNETFDYVITNPPWGAKRCDSKEIFSEFFIKSYSMLNKKGTTRFLFPESILNVKVHKNLRKFILENTCLKKITLYSGKFTGVVTDYVDIEIKKDKKEECIICCKNNKNFKVNIKAFLETDNFVFNLLSGMDLKILEKVKKIKKYSLKNSIWALGIVTGDNKNKLFKEKRKNTEAIWTGKEIKPYILLPEKNYIIYDRNNFQQIAPDEIYRADEKLVYKFISNKLTFAYDNKQKLFLNSANILIPKIKNMNIKTVMAFLNSKLYQYLYIKLFGEVKILRGNLEELPFPEITKEENEKISSLVDKYIKNPKEEINKEIQKEIYQIFSLNEDEIKYVEKI